jgi:Domain of unknown function (DUF5666)
MSRVVGAVSFALLLAVAFPSWVSAQEKTVSGTIGTVSASSLTVKVGGQDMTFTVDAKTVVEARGAGTADRKAEAAGAAGPKITDLLSAGQNVEVTYTAKGAMNHASKVRRVQSVPTEGGAKTAAPATMTSTGTVSAVGGGTFTINAGSGAQTFAVDGTTKVVGQGVGTATAAAGGKGAFADLVAVGDRVSVSYHQTGATMHAAEVRVTAKAKK